AELQRTDPLAQQAIAQHQPAAHPAPAETAMPCLALGIAGEIDRQRDVICRWRQAREARAQPRQWMPPALDAGDAGVAHPTAFAMQATQDRKSTRLNSSHVKNSYAVFCLKKKHQPLY